MSVLNIPSLDNTSTDFTEQDKNLFNKLDFYFATVQVRRGRFWKTYSRLGGSIPWRQNQGQEIRGIRTHGSPTLRQEFRPRTVNEGSALTDVHDTRETPRAAQVHRHKFESPIFNWLPAFQDFMKDHIGPNMRTLADQLEIANEQFIRTNLFDFAQHLWIADSIGPDGELITAPIGSASKTVGHRQQWLAWLGQPGNLTFNALAKAGVSFLEDVGAYPFVEGPPSFNSDELTDKIVLITSKEAWTNLAFDDYRLDNKTDQLNVVTQGMSGSVLGMFKTMTERYPLRMGTDGLFPAPESRIVIHENTSEVGELIPNPDYINAPYEFAFIIGADSFDAINIGPPPAPFAAKKMNADQFHAMRWNGEVRLTDQIVVPTEVDDPGDPLTFKANQYGEYLQLITDATFATLVKSSRQIMPLLFRRTRGIDRAAVGN